MVTSLQFRGPQVGRCNICGEVGKLTDDHTPPKGCYRPGAVEVQTLIESLNAVRGARKYKSNNGVRFRSLCARCNSELLGGCYDPELIRFTTEVSRIALFEPSLPRFMYVPAKPQKIMRSVYGHLAAARVDGYGQWLGHEKLERWFLDGRGSIPEDLKFYYWFYPYKPQVLVRGFGFTPAAGAGAGTIVIGWLMKFFPLGFLFATHGSEVTIDLPDMGIYRDLDLDATVDLPIKIRPPIHPHWPEANAGQYGMVLTGQDAMRATEQRLKSKIITN